MDEIKLAKQFVKILLDYERIMPEEEALRVACQSFNISESEAYELISILAEKTLPDPDSK